MGFDNRARSRRANDEPAIFLTDPDDPGDLLRIDNQFRLQPADAQLHQKVGTTRHNLGQAGCTGKEFDRIVHRSGCGIAET